MFFLSRVSQQKKNTIIQLPSNMILTKAGADTMHQSKNTLKRVLRRDGTLQDGMNSAQFNAPVLQKFVLNGFLEEVFSRLPELLSHRANIISTNNLIMYGLLYKKLSPALSDMLLGSSIVKEFNRKNPKQSIVDYRTISMDMVKALIQQKKELFQLMENDIRDQVTRLINDSNLPDEDRNLRTRALDKFLRYIDPRIWYLYLIIYSTPLQARMELDFAAMVYDYLDNTQIATHLSNLLMEFVQNAEKAHFEKIILSNNLTETGNIDKWLREKENRKKMIDIAIKSDQLLEISWNLNPSRNPVIDQYRIQILVSNKGLIGELTRGTLADKMKKDTDGISLSDFYQDSGDASKLGAGLGLLYNSYLEEICKKKGIKYFCNIVPESVKDRTTVQIDLNI